MDLPLDVFLEVRVPRFALDAYVAHPTQPRLRLMYIL